jgi:hypothetical protein
MRLKERAPFLKLVDRKANVNYSKTKVGKDGMFKKYKEENPKFIWGLVKPEWYEVHQWLYRLIIGKPNFLYYRINKNEYSEMITSLTVIDLDNG